MNTGRQKNQTELAFSESAASEAQSGAEQGIEAFMVAEKTNDPGSTDHLMEVISAWENIEGAIRRVLSNKGSPGIDNMPVKDLPSYFNRQWPRIHRQLLDGSYESKAVKRVVIEKPGGGERTLGIPTVVDRVIQQAMVQVLQPLWDLTFHDRSYGFRPGRSAHQAVAQAQSYIAKGYEYVVDIDLEKFFDRVNHDVLMSRVARRVTDKRVLKIIRSFLTAGLMDGGVVSPRREGTPQGGPLSPLLSNLLLDELDWELDRRGHHFVRYADDCNIYVKTARAGARVMESVEKYLGRKLRLRINHAKSAVAPATERSFLGFRFYKGRIGVVRGTSREAVQRFRQRVRKLTKRGLGRKLTRVVAELSQYLLGWRGYFGFSQMPSDMRALDGWIRRRLRSYHWEQWKTGKRRYVKLRQLGTGHHAAARLVWRPGRAWHKSQSPIMTTALPNRYFEELGLVSLMPA